MARETAAKTTKRTGESHEKSGGRPPKFREPSRSITVTLPQRTLDFLRWIDLDRAKAIVKAVDGAIGDWKGARPPVEVLEMASGTGLVVVPSHRSLNSVSWMKMIQIAPARYLLAIEPGTPIEKVEVSLMDLIDDATLSAPSDVPVLEALRATVGKLRRGGKVSKAEILLVDIE